MIRLGPSRVDFDSYARDYDRALSRGLAVSGETRGYFARGRVRHLAACLKKLDFRAVSILDFGCGTGATTPLLRALFEGARVVGVDTSRDSLEIARAEHGTEGIEFVIASDFEPREAFDLVYVNGVFHHVAPELRPAVARLLARALRTEGLLALWENNAWNPGTRWVMARIPFDRGARPLSCWSAVRLVARGGFDVVRTDHLFVFPRILLALRPLEARLTKLPLGAQYQILARRRKLD